MLLTAYCRIFQAVLHVGNLFLPWRKANRIEGAGCIKEIPGLLKENGGSKPMVVTDPGLKKRA